ncbi:MAG: twin transmembrane helix small protein [Rhodospirillales bacterium]|nr:MAG: twin transmembrane helix small protein [Rhodospirillales bacterium]
MQTILPFLLVGAMLATVGALFAGVIGFAFNIGSKHSTRLMTARVMLQGLALAVFGLMALISMT